MTDQPRLLDAHRRIREASSPGGRPEPSPAPAEAAEPPWTMMAGVLALAGWESKVRMGRRIWCRSRDDPWCPWYSEQQAYWIVQEGEA